MITTREVVSALYGVWRLAHFDENGWRHLDDSIDGFWKSFFAAVLVAPFHVITLLLSLVASDMPATAGPGRIIAVYTIAYVIGWVAFPVAMVGIADLLDRRDKYLRYIVGFNWAITVQVMVFLPVAILFAAVGLNLFTGLLNLVAVFAIATYAWFVARTGLGIPGSTAVAIVLLDLVISIALNFSSSIMIGRL